MIFGVVLYTYKDKNLRCVISQDPPPPLHPLIQNNNFEKQQKYLDKYVNNGFDLTSNFIVAPEFYKTDILYFDVHTVM